LPFAPAAVVAKMFPFDVGVRPMAANKKARSSDLAFV